MKEKIKIEINVENFRKIWSNEWDALIKLTGLDEIPYGKNSFRQNFPAIHTLLIDTLNQIRDKAREESEKDNAN